MNVASPFVWGEDGEALTPDQLKERKKIAQLMAQKAGDYSPVGHWTQGLARVADGMMAGLEFRDIDRAEKANATTNNALLAALVGGGSTAPATLDATVPSVAAAVPTGSAPSFASADGGTRTMQMPLAGDETERAKTVFDGLVNRGLSPVAAAGIAGNFHGESGFNPGIGGDNNTSFGLAQWRGDRLTALKQLAASQGKDWRDLDVQLDHTLNELKGPEARAYAAIQGAKSPEEAATLFMQHYERPADWAMRKSGPGRASMAAQIFSKFGSAPAAEAGQPGPVQVASADPSALVLPAPPTGPVAPASPVSIQTTPPTQAAVPAQAAQQQQAQAPAASPGVVRVAQAAQGIDPAVLAAMTNPAASPATRAVAQAVLQQRMQQQKLAAEQAYDQMSKAEQRAYDERVRRQTWTRDDQIRADTQGFQTRQADTAWERDRPYKDSASSISQGNLDIARERLKLDQDKPTYHNVPAGTTVLGANGQPVFTAPNKDEADKGATELRKEIQQLPSFKNYSQAVPIYRSMAETAGRNTKASDLNLVYGLGKIMDPTSVVREGEMVMVKNTAGLPEWLVGSINALNGGAALTPETRNAIMTEAYGRMNGYAGQFQQEIGQYKGIIQRRGFNPDDVIPNFGEITPYEPMKTGRTDRPAPGQPAPAQPAQPKSQADFQALPSGALFIAPDGTTRRKP